MHQISIHLRCCAILLLLLVISSQAIIREDITLESTLIRGDTAYAKQSVVFTCITTGSDILEWYSNEYIAADGDRIQIYNSPTRTNISSRVYPDTFAILVSTTIENRVTMIVSELHITASLLLPRATVTCRNNGHGTRRNITFSTIAIEEIILWSTLFDGRIAYPQQSVVFTCITRGSDILEWYSMEYIAADGDRIQIYNSPTRTNVSSGANPNTFAILVSVTIENGVTVIVSELHITASLQVPRAIVTCRNNGHGARRNITFSTITLQEVTLNSTLISGGVAYAEQIVVFICTIRGSEILEWYSNEYIATNGDHIQIYNSSTRTNVSSRANPNTFATLVSATTENRMTVIVSELHIIASLNYPRATVTCGNNGHGTRRNITFSTTDRPDPNIYNQKCSMCPCPGDKIEIICMTNDSDVLLWRSDDYIEHYELQFNLSNSIGSTRESFYTSAVLLNSSNENGRIQLTSSLSVVALTKMTYTISCINQDLATETNYVIEVSDKCDAGPKRNRSKLYAICAIIPSIFIIVIGVIVFLVGKILIKRGKCKTHPEKRSSQKKEMESASEPSNTLGVNSDSIEGDGESKRIDKQKVDKEEE